MKNTGRGYLTTYQQKGRRIHAFLRSLTVEAALIPGLAGLTLLGVDQYRESHILHSFFSVPVGSYSPDRQFFRCCRELPSERLLAITEISVASFAAWCVVSTVSQEEHIVHMEGVSPSSVHTKLCKKESDNAEGRNLTCQGLTFLPPDVAAPLLHMEGNVECF